jgi:threonylcarbamoyladenosine tRNA methylthiotransferase MtaB
MPSFFSIHFGCRANQADAAAIEADLSQRGFQAVEDPSTAQVVVLNSCTVTAAADSELRQTARRIHRENPTARILVTGCYAQCRPEELAALPGVEWVVGNSHKAGIGELLEQQGDSSSSAGNWVPLERLLSPAQPLDSDLRRLGSVAYAEEATSLPPPRVLVGDISTQRRLAAAPFFGGAIEDRTRPNLKIQDGCNNRCSFCIIPSVRGLSRSLAAPEVVRQIRALADAGYREVVLSGVNLGQYGRDCADQIGFARLIRSVLEETPVERLRLSSVEPMDWTEPLLDLMASTPRIARHVHAPLQSGSDRILRLMHRKYRASQYAERIRAACERMPDAAFGADVIVGFPGESDEDFEQTRRLIDSLPFTYLHVFPFSRRPGTPADGMKNQVHGSVVRERGRVLRELAAEKNRRFRERHLGLNLIVLTLGQTAADGTMGLSDNYLRVRISGDPLPPNQWVKVRIESAHEGYLEGARAAENGLAYAPPAPSPSMMTCASA